MQDTQFLRGSALLCYSAYSNAKHMHNASLTYVKGWFECCRHKLQFIHAAVGQADNCSLDSSRGQLNSCRGATHADRSEHGNLLKLSENQQQMMLLPSRLPVSGLPLLKLASLQAPAAIYWHSTHITWPWDGMCTRNCFQASDAGNKTSDHSSCLNLRGLQIWSL